MGMPARHRKSARSGEAGGPLENRPALPRDWTSNSMSQGPTPEDARLPARRAYSSERRMAISAVRRRRIREISGLG